MDERLEQLYIEELENNIKAKVGQEGYDVSYCKVDAVFMGDEKNEGIKKIDIIVSKKENTDKNNTTEQDKSKIQSVNKVEINAGLNKYIKRVEDDQSSKGVDTQLQELKKIISTYYEVESNKINISAK